MEFTGEKLISDVVFLDQSRTASIETLHSATKHVMLLVKIITLNLLYWKMYLS